MTDSLTAVLERAAGPVPPAPQIATLVEEGGRRRRRKMGATMTVAAAALAVAGVGVSTVWSSGPPVEPAPILDRPGVAYEPYEGQSIDVTLFFCVDDRCPAMSGEQQADLYERLVADPMVDTVYFESKQDAYERFAEQFADQPELVESVDPDVLPASFRVRLTDAGDAAAIVERFRGAPGVEEVVEWQDTLNPPE